ncbi:MAG: hypothetical protein LBL75_04255 [Rickettsiales bacterium]|jgi:hypothetical protein|nr:hypothetical protein [Rickettsiales bacterium]
MGTISIKYTENQNNILEYIHTPCDNPSNHESCTITNHLRCIGQSYKINKSDVLGGNGLANISVILDSNHPDENIPQIICDAVCKTECPFCSINPRLKTY